MTFNYKDFTAEVKWSDDDRLYVGRVKDISDIITFHSERQEDIEKEFRETIDSYLALEK